MNTILELIEFVKTGGRPVIQFNEKHTDYDADPGFRGRVMSFTPGDKYDDGQVIEIIVSLAEFEEYNKPLAQPNWKTPGKQDYTLTWFESGYYPKDGKYTVYVMDDQTCEEAGFVLLQENDLFARYISEKTSLSYIQWLENGWIKNNL